eukprot:scaffold287_cov337-Pavlova_lutheri.AAC.150
MEFTQSVDTGLAMLNTTLSATEATKGPIFLDVSAIYLTFLLIVLACGLSFHIQLGLEFQLLIASLRAVVQLTILGFLLVPIFKVNQIYVVLPYCVLMLMIAAKEASDRPAYRYKGMYWDCLASVTAASLPIMAYSVWLIFQLDPFWDARYFIPVLGMLLGNSVTSVSVSLSRSLEEFAEAHDRIEFMLSKGADRWEAVKPVIRRAVKMGLTPLINQLSVIGIVAIPGMMTGQILGGTPPLQAARYQLVILFLIAGCGSISSYIVLILSLHKMIDSHLNLRWEFLKKTKKGQGATPLLAHWLEILCLGTARLLSRLLCIGKHRSPDSDNALRRPLL